MKISRGKKVFLGILFVLALTIGIFSFFVKKDSQTAEALSIFSPFGGPIKEVKYCCNGILLTIEDRTSSNQQLKFLYQPGFTKLYRNYMIFTSGACTIGNAISGGTCKSGAYCKQSTSADGGTIYKIGTSLMMTQCKI